MNAAGLEAWLSALQSGIDFANGQSDVSHDNTHVSPLPQPSGSHMSDEVSSSNNCSYIVHNTPHVVVLCVCSVTQALC
jgi:hypothetical protein